LCGTSDRVTGNRLFNSTELKKALQSEVQRAEIAEQRADIEAQRADIEAKRANLAEQKRRAAEAEIARLKALLG